MVSIKKLFPIALLLALFCWCTLLTAAPVEDGGPCLLGSPSNVQPTAIGPTYITLAWNPLMGASNYKVKLTRESDGAVMFDQFVPGVGVSINNLTPNTTYRYRVAGVCSDGTTSLQGTEGIATTILIELVINSVSPGDNLPELPPCTELAWDPGQIYGFKVITTNREGKAIEDIFGVSMSSLNGQPDRLSISEATDNGVAYPTSESNIPPPVYNVEFIRLFQDQSLQTQIGLVRLELLSYGQQIYRLRICDQNLAAGYSFSLLGMPADSGGDGRSPSGFSASERPNAWGISPNPFTQQLLFSTSSTASTPVVVRLFDAVGRPVFEQRYEAGQEQFVLDTAGLPSGWYTASIETLTGVEVVRAIKM